MVEVTRELPHTAAEIVRIDRWNVRGQCRAGYCRSYFHALNPADALRRPEKKEKALPCLQQPSANPFQMARRYRRRIRDRRRIGSDLLAGRHRHRSTVGGVLEAVVPGLAGLFNGLRLFAAPLAAVIVHTKPGRGHLRRSGRRCARSAARQPVGGLAPSPSPSCRA